MRNYAALTTYELEKLHSSFMDDLMECDTDEQLDAIQEELDQIQDELDYRESLEKEEDDYEEE